VYVALSRCTSFNDLVLRTKIERPAIMTDPKVLAFAQNETQSETIIQELNDGKADYYYKKSREALKKNDYRTALENFIQAFKFRNDIETEVFKKYVITMGNRLSGYKTLCLKQAGTLEQACRELSEAGKNKAELQSKIKTLTHKNKEQNNAVKLLLTKADELSLEAERLRDENGKLKALLSKAESKYASERKLISELEKTAANQRKEIERLKKLKLSQRIFGVK
jgi:chromosome segregation ATPase